MHSSEKALSVDRLTLLNLSELEATLLARRNKDLSGLSATQQAELLAGRSQTIISQAELKERLARSKENRRPLEIKFGIDPTGADVHLGHAVPIILLQRLQRMGHSVTLVIGDSTALIGDPSGRTKDRPALSKKQIEANMASYVQQITPFLDIGRLKIKYNSSWLEQRDLLPQAQITGLVTMSDLLQRNDFRARIKAGSSLTLAELMYPVLMALDSVNLHTDIEVGGVDQLLNLQICRLVQNNAGQTPEVIITTPILIGTDTTSDKMSKSKGNYVPLNSTAEIMYKQLMSIPDSTLDHRYGRLEMFFKLLTEITNPEWTAIQNHMEIGKLDPREVKRMLAHLITQIVHGKDKANKAASIFKL